MYPNPADANLTGLVGLFLCGTGLLVALVWLGILSVLPLHSLLPCRDRRVVYWLGMLFFAPVLVFSVPCVATALQALAVIATLGWEDYAGGVRVVDKHGLLTNGQYLGVFWTAAIGGWMLPGMILLLSPMVAWYVHFHSTTPSTGSKSDIAQDGTS
jgi:hypothetical protein